MDIQKMSGVILVKLKGFLTDRFASEDELLKVINHSERDVAVLFGLIERHNYPYYSLKSRFKSEGVSRMKSNPLSGVLTSNKVARYRSEAAINKAKAELHRAKAQEFDELALRLELDASDLTSEGEEQGGLSHEQ